MGWKNALRGIAGMPLEEDADSLLARPPRNLAQTPIPRLPRDLSPEMGVESWSMDDPQLTGSPTAALTLDNPGSSLPRLSDAYEDVQPDQQLSPFETSYNERVRAMTGGRRSVTSEDAGKIRSQAAQQADAQTGLGLQRLEQTGDLARERVGAGRDAAQIRAETQRRGQDITSEDRRAGITERGREADMRNQARSDLLDLATRKETFFQTQAGQELALKKIEALHAISARERGLDESARRNELEAISVGMQRATAENNTAAFLQKVDTFLSSSGMQNVGSRALSTVPRPAYGGLPSPAGAGSDIAALPSLEPTIGGRTQLARPAPGEEGIPAGAVPLIPPQRAPAQPDERHPPTGDPTLTRLIASGMPANDAHGFLRMLSSPDPQKAARARAVVAQRTGSRGR